MRNLSLSMENSVNEQKLFYNNQTILQAKETF